MRIFLAHASGCGLPEIKKKVYELQQAVEKMLFERENPWDSKSISSPEPFPVQVVAGRHDHRLHWHGDWSAWQHGVVSRRDATTGRLVYDVFVIERMQCGKATAAILSEAIRQERPVFYWNGVVMERVEAIQITDSDDWISGWCVIREPKQVELDLREVTACEDT